MSRKRRIWNILPILLLSWYTAMPASGARGDKEPGEKGKGGCDKQSCLGDVLGDDKFGPDPGLCNGRLDESGTYILKAEGKQSLDNLLKCFEILTKSTAITLDVLRRECSTQAGVEALALTCETGEPPPSPSGGSTSGES